MFTVDIYTATYTYTGTHRCAGSLLLCFSYYITWKSTEGQGHMGDFYSGCTVTQYGLPLQFLISFKCCCFDLWIVKLLNKKGKVWPKVAIEM